MYTGRYRSTMGPVRIYAHRGQEKSEKIILDKVHGFHHSVASQHTAGQAGQRGGGEMDADPDLEHIKTECNQLIDRILKLQASGRLLDEEISRLEQGKADMLSGSLPCSGEKGGTDTGEVTCEGTGKGPKEKPCQEVREEITDVSGKEPEQPVPREDSAAGTGLQETTPGENSSTSETVPVVSCTNNSRGGTENPDSQDKESPPSSLPLQEEKLLKDQIAHKCSGKEVVVVYGQTGKAETMDRVLKVILLMAAIILLTAAATAVLYFIQKPDALPVAFRAILDGQWGQ